jgi:serine/threonine protein kinase
MSDQSEPRFLSHYRVISKLGAGGRGEVFLAEDTRLNRRLAIVGFLLRTSATLVMKISWRNDVKPT